MNLEMVRVERDHVLVTFDLFKRGVLKKKVDTALMRRAVDKPGGVAWVYVHESDHTLGAEPVIRRTQSGALVTG
ncbi:MAG: hypothetical protein IPL19_29965 [Sandaracinaceae bacterium]|nr:hypothetical protein [Sandaracinaceae bacterium]